MDTSSLKLSAVATVSTAVPRRYLGQLCKHFQHKLPATFDDQYRTGRIEFGAGLCELAAEQEQGVLTMRVRAASDEDLARLEHVVGSHLERFAFRETLNLTWVRDA